MSDGRCGRATRSWRVPDKFGFRSALAFALLFPGGVWAHTLVTPYTLPIPFRMYLYACVATLALTFVVLIGTARPAAPLSSHSRERSLAVAPERLVPSILLIAMRIGSVSCFLLTVIAGLIGTPSPNANIGWVLFWYLFLLLFVYLTAVIGNFYQLISPWRAAVEWTAANNQFWSGRISYPKWLAYWPALGFYIALVWIELLIPPRPSTLSWVLLGYGVLTFAGAWLFGSAAWIRHCEVFDVLFRVVGTLAPLRYARKDRANAWTIRFRTPLSGGSTCWPDSISLVVFVLFMLSSTAYDGVHGTTFWAQLYWENLMKLLQPVWGSDMARAQAILGPWYPVYDRLALLLSPVAYLGIYVGAIALAKRAADADLPVRSLAMRFIPAVVPIALAYSVAHYFSALTTTSSVVPFLISDPFGFGWDIFGTAHGSAEGQPIDMREVWHFAVLVILAGHVASVYMVHKIGLTVFHAQRRHWLGELPLLVLTVAYTLFGLFVLALPLALH